ncbi:LysR family transcriptional regulator [Sphingomonas profundi]|uniref:LysR family transcriptional regulator n=1 Tax=Alterirhizorhabdus profundi TaxID=2681549 RepID=UPI0012E99081|nr:LysR family transcriptional regulator [Sphingomonas profundi]
MIDRYLLRYFLAVIDQGGFSRAALACNVSQPTLSVGIAKLEKHLGQPLFLRANRRIALTDAGNRLATHARRIETEFALAERSLRGAPAETVLRLGVLATIPSAWIEAFLARRAAAGRESRVEIVEGRERELIARLERGRIDVALTIVGHDTGALAHDVLFSEGYRLALAATHPLATRASIAAGELAAETMIVRRQCELLGATSRFFTARGVRPFFAARTMSDDRALAYVRSGIGITIMPDGFAAPGVARVRMADFDHTRRIGLVHAPHADVARQRQSPVLPDLAAAIAQVRTG